jgi:hypothetical protein
VVEKQLPVAPRGKFLGVTSAGYVADERIEYVLRLVHDWHLGDRWQRGGLTHLVELGLQKRGEAGVAEDVIGTKRSKPARWPQESHLTGLLGHLLLVSGDGGREDDARLHVENEAGDDPRLVGDAHGMRDIAEENESGAGCDGHDRHCCAEATPVGEVSVRPDRNYVEPLNSGEVFRVSCEDRQVS